MGAALAGKSLAAVQAAIPKNLPVQPVKIVQAALAGKPLQAIPAQFQPKALLGKLPAPVPRLIGIK